MPKKTRNPPILEILDNLPVLVDAFDSENKIVFWNKKCEELIGYSKEEIIQHENPLSLLYPKKGYLEYMMEKIKKNEEAKSLEWEITCKNGDKRNILWSHFYMYSSLLDADVWAIGIDVTARHQISKKLRESEQKYRSLMENSPVGCFIVQEDQIKYANKVMADILGYSVEEILTWNMEKANEHIHPEDLKELWEDKDEFPNKEFRIISKNKEIKWIAQFSHEIPFQGKRANQIILIDVTDQKKTKKKLFDMKLKEQKINSLATLAGGIAHDFNNILVSILGNINLVQMDFPSNQVDLFVKEKDQLDVGEYREIWEDRILDLQDNLETMESAVRRAKGLTQQLLTFSKGGKPVKKVKSIMNVINKTLVLIGHGFNAEVKVEFEENLPLIEVDMDQIIQVFHNLILNAIESMEKGGVVKLKLEKAQKRKYDDLVLPSVNYLKISVIDTGKGIPADQHKNIFTPYFTTKKEGHGLGLAVSYSIVKKHNGFMNFESEEGKGTTFNVFLPITDKKRAEISPIISKKYMFSGKVLLMDDEKYVRNTLKQMLERLGFDVDTTKRGEETIKIYNEKMKQGIPYNLVIMDLTIPSGMGGKETMQYLKEINPEVLAIVSSGYSNDPIMGHPEEFGFADVLIKPYSLNKLRNLLSKYLKQ